MPLNLQIINPICYPGWDELLLSNPDYSFFHSSSWARALSESYKYAPIYFTVIKENKLLALIPIMEIKSLIRGKKGVSLPFTDYVEPIVSRNVYPVINKTTPCEQGKKTYSHDYHQMSRVRQNNSLDPFNRVYSRDVLDYLLEYGTQANWKCIEIRGGESLFRRLSPSSFFFGHTLDLLQDEDKIFSNFRGSTRRNIKKALMEGIGVSICNSPESIREFYRLNCMTRKMHGIPPQPYYFFKKVYDYIISKDHGFVALASHKGKVIAGAVYFHFGKKAIYKYGASDRTYQHLRANNLVMWKAIRWYCQKGYESLCFGRTEPENEGLRHFKAGWGTEERVIKYYRYDLKKCIITNNRGHHVAGSYNKVFQNMPVPVLKMFGTLLYKYMG